MNVKVLLPGMEKEKYEPTQEEIEKAEEMAVEGEMEPEQEKMTKERLGTLERGREDKKLFDIIQESLDLLKKAKNSGKRVLIVARRDNPNMPSRIEGMVKDFYDKYSNDRYRWPMVGVNESDLEKIKEKLEVRIYYHPDNPDYNEVVSLDEIKSIKILD